MPKRFAGIYAALLTPFKDDEVALDFFRDNVAKYNGTGLAGYVVLGSTGESRIRFLLFLRMTFRFSNSIALLQFVSHGNKLAHQF